MGLAGAITAGDYSASCACWTHLSRQWSSPPDAIDHGQHREGAIGVLGQAAIAGLGETPQPFQDKERVLYFGAHARLAPVCFLVRLGQRTVPVSAFVGEILCLGRKLLETLPLLLSPAGTVAIKAGLVAVQEAGDFMFVMEIGDGNAGAMDQAALAIDTDMALHAEVPRVPFLGLVPLRIARLVPVLGRGRRDDQGGIDDGATGQPQAVGLQQFTYLGEDRRPQVMGFEQMTKVPQGAGVGDAFVAQVKAAEVAECRDVVERFLAGIVRQVEPIVASVICFIVSPPVFESSFLTV